MEEEDQKCDIPDSLLTKLYDHTGNARGGNKGFYLFFINKNGDPNCIARPSDTTMKLACLKVIEGYPDMVLGEEEDD